MGSNDLVLPSQREAYEGHRPYGRGELSRALKLARSSANSCAEILLTEAEAASSRASNRSLLNTWSKVARECGFLEPFDLTPELIYQVMGVLKAAQYRSAANYLEAAKKVHVEIGNLWSDQLKQASRKAIRSTLRDLGPAKQAQPIPLVAMVDFRLESIPEAGAPAFPGRACIIASWWLLREIEASHVKLSHVKVDDSLKEASLLLPNSKNDLTALGATRQHRCSCSCTGELTCPFHCMVAQLTFASTQASNCGSWLFPTKDGLQPTKAGWSKSFERVAEKAGLPLQTEDGLPRFSGHSARASGAFHLAKSNVDLWRIQIFGRWKSAAFLRYVRDSPLANLNQLASEASLAQSLENARRELTLLRRVESEPFKAGLAPLEVETVEELPLPETPVVEGPAKYVHNNNSAGKIHVVWVQTETIHPRHWRAKCGWYFARGLTDYAAHSEIPPGNKCRKCFNMTARHPKVQASSSESSSTDS